MIYSTWRLYQYLDSFTAFRDSLLRDDPELVANLDQRLHRLQIMGNQAQEPVSKYVEDGILECKAKSAQHQARLLFCFQPGTRIVILLGILKDQRKLKRADIEEAKRRRAIIESQSEFIRGLHSTH